MNIHWTLCIENIFTVQDFWATCASPEKQFPLKIFTVLNIFHTIQDFWATLGLPWKAELALEFFTVLNVLFTFRFLSNSALALKNRVPWIHCIEYMFFTVTYGDFRGWGGTVSFKAKFASMWTEWSSINSPLNWLLAEWLLNMLSIPYHNLLHT